MSIQTEAANSHKPIENIQGQAIAQQKANKLEAALDLYLHSIEIDRHQPEWIYANAITLAAQIDRCDTGFKLKRQAEDIYPQNDEIIRAIALLFQQQNQRHDAIKYYQKSIAINPQQPEWLYVKLFNLLTESKLLVEATKIKKQGLTLFPQSSALQVNIDDQNERVATEQLTQNVARSTPKSIEHNVDLDISNQRRQLMDSAIVNQYQILLEQILFSVTKDGKKMDTNALVHCLAEIKTDIHYLKTKLLDPSASAVDPQAKSLVAIDKIVNSTPPIPIKCELKERIVGSGWHSQEAHGRWTGPGTLSSIVLPYPTPGRYKLEVIVRAEAKSGLLQTLKINLGDLPVDISLTQARGGASFPAVITGEITITPEQNQPFLTLDLTIAETVNPPASDSRLLGLLVEKITLIPLAVN